MNLEFKGYKTYPILRVPERILKTRELTIPYLPVPPEPVKPKKDKRRFWGIISFWGFIAIQLILYSYNIIERLISPLSLIIFGITFVLFIKDLVYNKARYYKFTADLVKYRLQKKEYKNIIDKNKEIKQKNSDQVILKQYRRDKLKQVLLKTGPADIPEKNNLSPAMQFFHKKLSEWFSANILININVKNAKAADNNLMHPDFIFIDGETNLHIDIEIDEPYDLETGKPIVFLEKDDIWQKTSFSDQAKDEFFLQRTWVVIRFAEEQIVKYPDACCKFIADTVFEITQNNYYSKRFFSADDIKEMPIWCEKDIPKLVEQKYREIYLGLINEKNKKEKKNLKHSKEQTVISEHDFEKKTLDSEKQVLKEHKINTDKNEEVVEDNATNEVIAKATPDSVAVIDTDVKTIVVMEKNNDKKKNTSDNKKIVENKKENKSAAEKIIEEIKRRKTAETKNDKNKSQNINNKEDNLISELEKGERDYKDEEERQKFLEKIEKIVQKAADDYKEEQKILEENSKKQDKKQQIANPHEQTIKNKQINKQETTKNEKSDLNKLTSKKDNQPDNTLSEFILVIDSSKNSDEVIKEILPENDNISDKEKDKKQLEQKHHDNDDLTKNIETKQEQPEKQQKIIQIDDNSQKNDSNTEQPKTNASRDDLQLADISAEIDKLYADEKWTELLELTDKVLEKNPDYIKALKRRSAARGNLGDINGVIDDSTRLIELLPNDPEPYYNRALARYFNKNPKLAVTDFTKAVDLGYFPDHKAIFGIALAYFDMEEYKTAYDYLIQAAQKGNANAAENIPKFRKAISKGKASNGDLVKTLKISDKGIRDLAFSHDKRYIAIAEFSKKISLYETSKWNKIADIDVNASSIAFCKNNKTFIAGSFGEIIFFDIESAAKIKNIRNLDGDVKNLTCSDDGKYIIYSDNTGVYKFFVENNKKNLIKSTPIYVAVSRNARKILFADNKNNINIYNCTIDKTAGEFGLDPNETIKSACFSADYNSVIVALNKKVILFDIRYNKITAVKEFDTNSKIVSLAYHPDGKTFVVSTDDRHLKTYLIDNAELLKNIDTSYTLNVLKFSNDGIFLASGGFGNEVYIRSSQPQN